MELIILGSSGAIPVSDRNLPSIALKLDHNSETIIFDCGEDVQRKFNDAGLKFNKPLKILISHLHGDHVIGLPGLLLRFGLVDRSEPLLIFGPRKLFGYIFLHTKTINLKADYPITIFEIDHQTNTLLEYEGLNSELPKSTYKIENNKFFETDRYTLNYTIVEHSILTFAYSLEEKPYLGKFNPERARELGIPESNLWKKLHNREPIEFNGTIIDPIKEGIVGPERPGKKITYSSDTAPCDALIELGKDSDVLIHESTYAKEKAEVAKEKLHSTSIDAANDAVKMNAKQLVLTHFSSRYPDPSILLEEAKEIFPNTILGEDLLRIKL